MDSGAEPAKAFCLTFTNCRLLNDQPCQAAASRPKVTCFGTRWEVEKMYSQLNADSSRMPAREDIQPVSYEEAPIKASAIWQPNQRFRTGDDLNGNLKSNAGDHLV